MYKKPTFEIPYLVRILKPLVSVCHAVEKYRKLHLAQAEVDNTSPVQAKGT